MKRNRRNDGMYGKKETPVWVFVLIVLLLLAVLAFGLASVWQRLQDGPKDQLSSVGTSVPDVLLEPDTPLIPELEDIKAKIPEKKEEKEIIKLYTRRPEFSGAVEETEKMVGYDYFDDAIFFGDSISTGIAPYLQSVLPEVAVIAKTGVNPYSAATNEVIDVNGVNMTMLDAAKEEYGPRKKVYIMLGSNGLDSDQKGFIEGYRDFIRLVKKQYPDAVIYLQSMPPVTGTPEQEIEYPSLNNAKIDDYNQAIMKLAADEKVYYLDIAVSLADENGKLPVEASPDGVHFIGEYYYKWFDYLRKHTVDTVEGENK